MKRSKVSVVGTVIPSNRGSSGSRLPCCGLKVGRLPTRIRGLDKEPRVRLAIHAAQLGSVEITDFQRFFSIGSWRSAHAFRSEQRRHPRNAIAVRVGARADCAAEHADDTREGYVQP